MVDALALRIILPAMGRAGERKIILAHLQSGRDIEIRRRDGADQIRDMGRRGGFRLVGLPHHHPAHKVQHDLVALVAADGAHIGDAGFAVGILLEPDDGGARRQGVARIDRRAELALGVAEIGDGIQRDVGDRPAEHDVEHQDVVDRRLAIADRSREGIRGMQREARAGQADIKRDVARRDGARHGMDDLLPQLKILEEVAWVGLDGHSALTVAGPRRAAPYVRLAERAKSRQSHINHR